MKKGQEEQGHWERGIFPELQKLRCRPHPHLPPVAYQIGLSLSPLRILHSNWNSGLPKNFLWICNSFSTSFLGHLSGFASKDKMLGVVETRILIRNVANKSVLNLQIQKILFEMFQHFEQVWCVMWSFFLIEEGILNHNNKDKLTDNRRSIKPTKSLDSSAIIAKDDIKVRSWSWSHH